MSRLKYSFGNLLSKRIWTPLSLSNLKTSCLTAVEHSWNRAGQKRKLTSLDLNKSMMNYFSLYFYPAF